MRDPIASTDAHLRNGQTTLHEESPPSQQPANAAECALVGLLVETARESLSDRLGERHPPPWIPQQNVRIGVLPPRFTTPEATADDNGDYSDLPKTPAPTAETVEAIGVDFFAELVSVDETTVEISVGVDFALYQPLLPTLAEMRVHARGDAELGHEVSDGTSSAPSRITVPDGWLRSNVSIEGIMIAVPLNGDHMTYQIQEMDTALLEAVSNHFARPDAAVPFGQLTRTVPHSALTDADSWRAAIRSRADKAWNPVAPTPSLVAFAERLPDGTILVSVSLLNDTAVTPGQFQDHTLYDCRVHAQIVGNATPIRRRFQLAPDDYRYHDLVHVVGQGRNCVAIHSQDGVSSETLPIYEQPVVTSRTDHVAPPRWDDLAQDPMPVLSRIESEMLRYLTEWDAFLQTTREHRPDVFAASELERDAFLAEIQSFRLGMEYLRTDVNLMTSFQLANLAFKEANRSKPYDSWRLFQIVYIVGQLPALGARRHRNDERLRKEHETADVLWFPTGGGKTEAYLGLVVTALFYDRQNDKSDGVSAWLRFPLRMLSVQQLSRVLRVLVAADALRLKNLQHPGASFSIGYLVGGQGTPNSLFWSSGWWPGIESIDRLDAAELKRRRLVAACPNCGNRDSIRLDPSTEDIRIYHVCKLCDYRLPLYMTDDEVFRYQPSVIVSTVDKITGYAHYGEFTSFSRGPAYRCPEHGYFSFGGCLARHKCKRAAKEMETVTEWPDPVPSISIQDELHLVREELGTFTAHFEGLLTELQAGGPSRLPTKVLAATATIEEYGDQLRHVYGRRPRRFPSPGFDRKRGFYTVETSDVRRVFLGVMPTGGGTSKVEVVGRLQVETEPANDFETHYWSV